MVIRVSRFIPVFITLALLSSCSAFMHGYDTSDYIIRGWMIVDEEDAQKYSGFHRLMSEMNFSTAVNAAVDINGNPDYIKVDENNLLYLAYLTSGRIITVKANAGGKILSTKNYKKFGYLPSEIYSKFALNESSFSNTKEIIKTPIKSDAKLNVTSFSNTQEIIKTPINSDANVFDGPKYALVIGNGNYINEPLKNPVHDAEIMASTLRSLGFSVDKVTNADRKTMRKKVRAFGEKLGPNRLGLFYFAGHGVQVEGKNFLIPTEADIKSEEEVFDEAIDAEMILRKMKYSGASMNIVIFDACRNNPFPRKFRSSSRGLARIEGPAGSFIAYSTSPGSLAEDGDGKNSLYTHYLAKAMSTPNLTIEQVFKRVRAQVRKKTGGNQIPWESSSLEKEFYFSTSKIGNSKNSFYSSNIETNYTDDSAEIRHITDTNNFQIIEYNTGDLYKGEILDDKRHGKGTYIWKNGDIFEGNFINDKFNYGKYTFGSSSKNAGDVYEGDILGLKWHGKGKYTFGRSSEYAGDVYEGDFLNGKWTGKGKYIFGKSSEFAGDIYEGDIIDGVYEGNGKYSFGKKRRNNAGDIYEGEFIKGKRNGLGKYTWSNGDVYHGYWKNDRMTGEGIKITGGKIERGIFKNGKLKQTKYIDIEDFK